MIIETLGPIKTPVLLLFFNRPDLTQQVFNSIRSVRPPKLFLASDGARMEVGAETELVIDLRDQILSQIDWKCEIFTLFRDQNLGCKHAVSSAISWFFEHVEEGIILEDDCLPSTSFFYYCEVMLEKYRENERIFLVSGQNLSGVDSLIQNDYGFTKFALIWGWASWRRVWENYDVNVTKWGKNKKQILKKVSTKFAARLYWLTIFDRLYQSQIDTWDYQLSFLILSSEGKTIIPKKNLISNIGFDERATHTKEGTSTNANLPRHELDFPLVGPKDQMEEIRINEFYDQHIFAEKSWFNRLIRLPKYLSLMWFNRE